ncbi:HindVP family restriction endonuclease [Agrobacterium salinitolerans]|nr:HindVP family restriction endonuclease [Agrobacterium salinitolerans]
MWSKNTFNSSFPVALLLWMHSRGIEPIFVESDVSNCDLSVVNIPRPAAEVVKPGTELGEVRFDFEAVYPPFEALLTDEITKHTKLDVVFACDAHDQSQNRPFEVKLTVVPDTTTARKPRDQWSSEIVIRPSSVSSASMSIFMNMKQDNREMLKALIKEYRFSNIKDWNVQDTILNNLENISDFSRKCLELATSTQVPFLLQPVWGTEGVSLELSVQAFDMFVWTDVALMTMIFYESTGSKSKAVARSNRSVVRFCKTMVELLERGAFNYETIFRDIAFEAQTDKELAISGSKLRRYIKSPCITERRVSSTDIAHIIPNKGIALLKPERRLDQVLVFKFGQNGNTESEHT